MKCLFCIICCLCKYLSAVQTFLFSDLGEWVDFKKPMWSDTHLLTGSLKLYFRELPNPLIPFNLFDRCIDAMRK